MVEPNNKQTSSLRVGAISFGHPALFESTRTCRTLCITCCDPVERLRGITCLTVHVRDKCKHPPPRFFANPRILLNGMEAIPRHLSYQSHLSPPLTKQVRQCGCALWFALPMAQGLKSGSSKHIKVDICCPQTRHDRWEFWVQVRNLGKVVPGRKIRL